MRYGVVLAIVLLSATSAWGQPCDTSRVKAAGHELDGASSRARWWRGGWLTLYTAAGATHGVLAVLADDRDDRIARTLDASKAGIAALALVVKPLVVVHAAREFPAGCEDSARAESVLRAAAADEARRTGWGQRGLAVALNGTHALTTGLWLGRWTSAGISFATGMLSSELQIRTLGSRSRDALRIYLSPGAGSAGVTGLTLGGTF